MTRVKIEALRAAEPSRWPGYPQWYVDTARAKGAEVTPTYVRLSDGLHGWLAREVARRVPVPAVAPPSNPDRHWHPLHAGALTADLSDPEAFLDDFQFNLPTNRYNPREQFARLRAARPLPVPVTRAGLCRYTHDLHADSDRSRSRPGDPVVTPPYGHAAAEWGWPLPDGPDDRLAACHVISLHRTPDRLAAFEARFPAGWPYRYPRWFSAVDGRAEPLTPGWPSPVCPRHDAGGQVPERNRGAMGCRASWLAVLDGLIADGVDRPALVMEDDCQFAVGGAGRIGPTLDLLDAADPRWDLLFLGGQHHSPATPVRPGLVRCNDTGRTHALILHPRFFAPLREFWRGYANHVDWGLRSVQQRFRMYAADPFLAQQFGNTSTITGRAEGDRAWDGRFRAPATGAAGTGPAAPARATGAEAFRAKLEARRSAPWPDAEPVPPPAVFYHVACMNHWRAVVREQCRLFAHVGLTEVTAAVLGTPAEVGEAGAIAAACGVRLAVAFTSAELSLVELPTLRLLHRWAKGQADPRPCIYVHTKGVSNPADPIKTAWRRLMMRHVVADWRENVRRARVADLVGVNWGGGGRYPHFSGNVFMARSDWIAGLQEPAAYRVGRPDFTWAGGSWRGRFFAETWVGSKPWHHVESLAMKGKKLWEGDEVFRHDSAVPGFDWDGP